MTRICVFCGSASGVRDSYANAARDVGRLLASRGITVVYGGANVGLMGIVADSALEAGGRVIGVMPKMLAEKEIAHTGLTEMHVVGSMHERIALMAELSDAFIALPGGFGTFEEFCEVLTWGQLGLHTKPCGLLNVEGYYGHLLALFDRAVEEKLLKPAHRAMVLAEADPARLLADMLNYVPPRTGKWIRPKEI